MTNFEKYKDEILNFIDDCKFFDCSVAVDLTTGKPEKCCKIDCNKCLFRNSNCNQGLIKWLYEEYKELKIETPKLSKFEFDFCNTVLYGYIVRNEDGDLVLFKREPVRKFATISSKYGYWTDSYDEYDSGISINITLFPFITWNTSKKWSVEELRKLEVKE